MISVSKTTDLAEVFTQMLQLERQCFVLADKCPPRHVVLKGSATTTRVV